MSLFVVGELVDVGVGYGVVQEIAECDEPGVHTEYRFVYRIKFPHRIPRRFGYYQRSRDRHERWFYETFLRKLSILIQIAWAAQ